MKLHYITEKINRVGIIILFSFIPILSFSQQNVRGVVLDRNTQEPITGATVVILSGHKLLGATTDSKGNFIICDIPAGRREIIISMRGFRAYVGGASVQPGEDAVLEVMLEANPTVFSDFAFYRVELDTESEADSGSNPFI